MRVATLVTLLEVPPRLPSHKPVQGRQRRADVRCEREELDSGKQADGRRTDICRRRPREHRRCRCSKQRPGSQGRKGAGGDRNEQCRGKLRGSEDERGGSLHALHVATESMSKPDKEALLAETC